MPPAKKRKTAKGKAAVAVDKVEVAQAPAEAPAPASPPPETEAASTTDNVELEPEPAPAPAPDPASSEPTGASSISPPSTTSSSATAAADRLSRFRALQARAKKSSNQNLAEATRESQRLASDPAALAALQRKRDAAAYKLLKAETEEAGEDFERKRAWDWTAEESERWDKRLKKRAAARDNAAFQDYSAESAKTYKRQVAGGGLAAPDLAAYARSKMAAIERAAAGGSLEIVETEDGELVAVDREGGFYATAGADATAFADSKPDKAAVDRLVAEMKKAEENRLRKRRERMAANGDDGDVTYINEKNKQFNQKLDRFYNKYTQEIRDSFERGTMI